MCVHAGTFPVVHFSDYMSEPQARAVHSGRVASGRAGGVVPRYVVGG